MGKRCKKGANPKKFAPRSNPVFKPLFVISTIFITGPSPPKKDVLYTKIQKGAKKVQIYEIDLIAVPVLSI